MPTDVLSYINTDIQKASDELDYLLAQQSSIHFAVWTSGGALSAPKHLVYISGIIDPMIDAGNARIILCAPPRHGKSETVNVSLVSRFLWRNPKRRVILAGHNATFAATWGRKVRDLLCENVKRLGVRIRGGFDAAMDEWYTDNGGGMRCAGIGVGIVGIGADLFIIDDPTPDAKAAWSSGHQQDLRDWYTGVADRRLEPGASVIVSMQRWPGDDFVSWLTSMKDQGRENWVFIRLPDIYDVEEMAFGPDPLGRDPFANGGNGEALWPERWPLSTLLQKKLSSEDDSFYYAQYRQRPPDKSMERLAYSSFSPTLSITENPEYNPKLPVLWTLDFNVDPMCSLIAQVKPEVDERSMDPVLGVRGEYLIKKTMTVLDEIFLRNSSTQRACEEFVKWIKKNNRKGDPRLYITVYGDASGWSRNRSGSPDYTIIREMLREAIRSGELPSDTVVVVRAPGSNPRQRDRVSTVNNAFLNSTGERRLFIGAQCIEIRKDLLFMEWKRDTAGKPTEDLDDSNPMRGHISDALGYLCSGELKTKAEVGPKRDRLI